MFTKLIRTTVPLVIIITLFITLPLLENIHRLPDTLEYILTHVWVTIEVEERNPITNGRATGQQVREGTPIAASQSWVGYRDGT
jgi:hypothetical protein